MSAKLTPRQQEIVERAILKTLFDGRLDGRRVFDGRRSANFLTDIDEAYRESTSIHPSAGRVYAHPTLDELEQR